LIREVELLCDAEVTLLPIGESFGHMGWKAAATELRDAR